MARFALIWLFLTYAALAQIAIFAVNTKEHLTLFGKYYKLNQKAIDKISELGCALPANIIVSSHNDNSLNAVILTKNNQNIELVSCKKNGVQKINLKTTAAKYKENYSVSDVAPIHPQPKDSYIAEAVAIFKKHAGVSPIKMKVLSKNAAFGNIIVPLNDKAMLIEGEQNLFMFMFLYEGGIYDKNGVLISDNSPSMPVEFTRVSDFYSKSRFHPILKYFRPHEGVDLAAPQGTPVSSVLDGVAEEIGYNPNIGNYVRIRHKEGYESVYGHLSKVRAGLNIGGAVKKRELIGLVGQTGLATGPHLHFGVQKEGEYIDPAVFFAKKEYKKADGGFFVFAEGAQKMLLQNNKNGGKKLEH